MKAIVLKTSTYKRVVSRVRCSGFFEEFSSFVSRVSHDSAGTYLYFESFYDLSSATTYLSAFNAVYRVIEICC